MPMKKSGGARSRAWSILRLALLWGRKGGVFGRRLFVEPRILPKLLRGLGRRDDAMRYGERELSFEDTPIFPRAKVSRPGSMRFLLPCIHRPPADLDYDFGGGREEGIDVCYGADEDRVSDSEEKGEEKSIDLKAEEFISKFYEQMKLQRQISYLQYIEMLNRGTA